MTRMLRAITVFLFQERTGCFKADAQRSGGSINVILGKSLDALSLIPINMMHNSIQQLSHASTRKLYLAVQANKIQ